MSYLTLEALKASKILEKYNIGCEIIDLVSLKPLNINKIVGSLKKNKKITRIRYWVSLLLSCI